MPHGAGVPLDSVANTMDGDVFGTVLQTSTINGGVHIHQPRTVGPAAVLPFRVGVVPLRAASFQERAAGDLVASVLGGGDAAVLISDSAGQATVLTGLGGVGKTQLAADYAERVWAAGEVELLVWVTAGSREAIVSGYARVTAMLTGLEDPDPERAARSLLEWLAGAMVSWLVVLDDIQVPGDLAGLWPPVTKRGRVVVTTRRRDTALRGYRRRLVEVGVFTEAEAQAYLAAALADQPGLLGGAAGLVRDLGCLPLALAQAAAYMLDRQLSCSAYRVRLAERRLASVAPEPDGLPDEHRATVAATWSLSVQQADLLVPEGVARPLLEVASVLDANGIPLGVFTAPAVLEVLSAMAGRVVDEHDARDGLGCLHRLSLITLNPDSPSRAVRVHALVQRATRDNLPTEQAASAVRAAADAVLQVWPDIERDTVLTQLLRANTDALNTAGGRHLWQPNCHRLLFRSGGSLGDSGLVTKARDYYAELCNTLIQQLGADHPDTLAARNSLAYWRGEVGDPTGAATAFEQLLTDRLRVLGPDHPDTLSTRHNLARWRGEAGDPTGAATAFEQLLTDRLRVLGPDHLHTLSTRNNLAQWKRMSGRLSG